MDEVEALRTELEERDDILRRLRKLLVRAEQITRGGNEAGENETLPRYLVHDIFIALLKETQVNHGEE